MKKTNSFFVLLAFLLVCLLPTSGQAYVQLDDKLYDQLFNGASATTYNTGAVLIYRGWNANVGYKTEMIKAIPHVNIVNLTGQTLQIANAVIRGVSVVTYIYFLIYQTNLKVMSTL